MRVSGSKFTTRRNACETSGAVPPAKSSALTHSAVVPDMCRSVISSDWTSPKYGWSSSSRGCHCDGNGGTFAVRAYW